LLAFLFLPPLYFHLTEPAVKILGGQQLVSEYRLSPLRCKVKVEGWRIGQEAVFAGASFKETLTETPPSEFIARPASARAFSVPEEGAEIPPQHQPHHKQAVYINQRHLGERRGRSRRGAALPLCSLSRAGNKRSGEQKRRVL